MDVWESSGQGLEKEDQIERRRKTGKERIQGGTAKTQDHLSSLWKRTLVEAS